MNKNINKFDFIHKELSRKKSSRAVFAQVVINFLTI